MSKMMEKKNNDKGELIDRTAWFTRLRARQQSAKNSNRFSNRTVVFKHGNFQKQKQDASRIKTETTQF